MINQQLISYIKYQLQQGELKDKITKDLMDNGWNSKDIEDGFSAIVSVTPNPFTAKKPKKHTFIKIFFILIILALIAGGVYTYYFKNDVVSLPFVQDFLKSDILKQIPYIKDFVKNSDTTLLQDDVETPETAVRQKSVSHLPSEIPLVDTTTGKTTTKKP